MPPFFFASCLTLLAENFCKSTLYLLMVLETKSSSLRKNRNISLCKILAVSGGYLARQTCACTALCPSSTEWLSCLKLVSRSNLALTPFTCGLQKSSYWAHIVSKQRSSAGKHQETYWSIPKSLLHAMTFLHFLDSGNMASSKSKYSHTSASTWEIYDTSYHSLSNPSWALEYMV